MVHVVLGALRTARFTDIRADATELLGKLRIPAHERRGHPADFGAVAVEPDALGHRRQATFPEARIGTVLASPGAFDTGLDAGSKFFMGHGEFLHDRVGLETTRSATEEMQRLYRGGAVRSRRMPERLMLSVQASWRSRERIWKTSINPPAAAARKKNIAIAG